MHLKKILLATVVVASLSSFTPDLYEPTKADAKKAKVSLNTLKEGKDLYINKCSTCHGLNSPDKYSRQRWVKIMDKMQKPAKLDSIQRVKIMNYINARLD